MSSCTHKVFMKLHLPSKLLKKLHCTSPFQLNFLSRILHLGILELYVVSCLGHFLLQPTVTLGKHMLFVLQLLKFLQINQFSHSANGRDKRDKPAQLPAAGGQSQGSHEYCIQWGAQLGKKVLLDSMTVFGSSHQLVGSSRGQTRRTYHCHSCHHTYSQHMD